jgi:hypothetical protein
MNARKSAAGLYGISGGNGIIVRNHKNRVTITSFSSIIAVPLALTWSRRAGLGFAALHRKVAPAVLT